MSEQRPPNPHYTDPVPTAFDQFHLVLLEPNPDRAEPTTDEERAALQQSQMDHLKLLKDLYDQGVSVGAGPFNDGGGGLMIIRGDKATEEEIKAIMAKDAHVASGRLTVVVRSFVLPKDVM